MVVRVTHNFIPAVQRPQMPANKNKKNVYSIEHCSEKGRIKKRRNCVKSAFDARLDRLSVYNGSCARKTQLEVRADPAEDLLQRWVLSKPIPSLLIGGAETVHDSGVGDCGEILIFGCQYGTVTLKDKPKKKKIWGEQWR